MGHLMRVQQTAVIPSLVGKNCYAALHEASTHHFVVRVIAEIVEPRTAPGTVIEQRPRAGTLAKLHQTIELVVVKEVPLPRAPHCCGIDLKVAQKKIEDVQCLCMIHYLESSYPRNYVFAQFPAADAVCSEKTIVVYVSSGSADKVIMPSFVGKTCTESIEECRLHGIEPVILKTSPTSMMDAIVQDQRPRPRAILDLSKKPLIQLQV